MFEQIITLHQQGTRFGIRVDPADGLLMQGAPGYPLTWMDAKVGDLGRHTKDAARPSRSTPSGTTRYV